MTMRRLELAVAALADFIGRRVARPRRETHVELGCLSNDAIDRL